MNKNYELIIIKGEDKTKEVESIKRDELKGKYQIKFYNGKTTYSYSFKDVDVQKYIGDFNIENKNLYYKNKIIFNVKRAIKYECCVKVIYRNEYEEIYNNAKEISTKMKLRRKPN